MELTFVLACFTPLVARGGLSFNGTNQYVTFGPSPSLGSRAFTVETWFNWTGRGVPANTGVGGIMAIPLVTKLAAEKDADTRDGNYFLGIRPGDGVLVADMEEGAAGVSPGTNHPVIGVTAITTSVWHHAAVTYDGTNYQLFLDGNLETTVFVGQPPRWDSLQHAALASSVTSTGAPQGFFSGMLENVRIWNFARSASQIASNRNVQITSTPGLLGCWFLDETGGTVARDSSGAGVNGRLVHGPLWTQGEKAPADVITPVKLTVIDPYRTEVLRQAEARRVPAIFRFDPAVSEQAETDFRQGFLMTREKFLAAIDEAFPRRQTDAQVLTNARLPKLISTFQSKNKGFPLSSNLVRIWALGHSDELLQSDWSTALRDAMARNIRPDSMPNDAKMGPPQVRLFALGFTNAAPDLDAVEKLSQSVARTNLIPLSRARSELQRRFPTNQQAIAKYLTNFVRENCIFDEDLTRRSRARRTESLLAADHYEPGQVVVRQGQVVDARVRAALDELKARTASEQAAEEARSRQQAAEAAARKLQESATIAEFKSEHFGKQNRWLLGGLLLVAVASSLAVWQLVRSRRPSTLLPVPVGQRGDFMADQPPDPSDEAEVEAWRQRALAAEHRAAQTTAAVRAGLLPHFAHWLKQKFVRGLLAERTHLLTTQETAEIEVAELERRLAQLQAPLEERLQAYQQRIAELEQELAAKGEENRELIQAKIEQTRKRLAAEQGQDEVNWN